MFRIIRTAGVTALLAVCTLMSWSSDALAGERSRHQLVERRHHAGPHLNHAFSPRTGLHAHHRDLSRPRQLARERDQLVLRARRALSRGRFESASLLFWRAVRVERQLNRAVTIQRRHQDRPHGEQRRPDRDRRDRQNRR